MKNTLIVRYLQQRDYLPVWEAMRAFTDQRDAQQSDEVWLVEHPPVFTLGQNGRPEHILNPGDIPVISVDRGGQVTYHGPGQLVAYVLIDIRRRHLGVRQLVTLLETAVIDLLATLNIVASARPEAPGVYVDGEKIAAVGLRIRRGCSFHGLSLNVDMDLTPFKRINPCGYANLAVTQLADFGVSHSIGTLSPLLINSLSTRLGYTAHTFCDHLPITS